MNQEAGIAYLLPNSGEYVARRAIDRDTPAELRDFFALKDVTF